SSLPSSLHVQLSARSGTIVCMLFCAMCWSYITRLLKTPIIGLSAAPVASSGIDMLAGLSKNEILMLPPDFCASARSRLARASSTAAAVAMPRRCRFMASSAFGAVFWHRRLFVEPDVLEAPFVVDAVGHPGPTLEPRLPARGAGRIEDHRPERRFRQL